MTRPKPPQRSPTITKRSILIAGHATSVSLEDPFWTALADIAAGQNTTPAALVARIDGNRRDGNLSSAIRVFVLEHYKAQALNKDRPHPDPVRPATSPAEERPAGAE